MVVRARAASGPSYRENVETKLKMEVDNICKLIN